MNKDVQEPSQEATLPVEARPETDATVQDMCIRDYHALVPKRTAEEEEAEEQEWDTIVSKPRVRQALRRIAAEARRQYYAGETEEGGFGLE